MAQVMQNCSFTHAKSESVHPCGFLMIFTFLENLEAWINHGIHRLLGKVVGFVFSGKLVYLQQLLV